MRDQAASHLRCLLAVGSLARGGAERQTLLSAAALRSLGVDARVFVISPPLTLAEQENVVGAPLLDPPTSRQTVARQIGRFRRAVDEFAPDVVVTFLASASWRFALVRAGSSSARAATWIVAERGNVHASAIVRSPASLLVRRAFLRGADAITVNSHSLAANVVAVEPGTGTKLLVVPNVIVPLRLDAARAKLEAAELLGDRSPYPLLGAIGSFQDDRNYELLVDAFARVVRSHPGAHLLIIGRTTGPECERSARRVQDRLERLRLTASVTLAGERPHARAILPALDAFILPSKLEGSSNALAEAILAGIPIASTPVADTPELLRGAGAVALGWTPDALARAVLEALERSSELRSAARARASELIEERSPQRVGRLWLDAMEQAIALHASVHDPQRR